MVPHDSDLESKPTPTAKGQLVNIWRKRARLLPMDTLLTAQLDKSKGMKGNANRGGKRQITLLSLEAWRHVQRELGVNLDPSLRRANLLIEGLDLYETRGQTLQVGEARILVWGETVPCRAMEEAHSGLQAALAKRWRGGVFGEVTQGGLIHLGDPVQWQP